MKNDEISKAQQADTVSLEDEPKYPAGMSVRLS